MHDVSTVNEQYNVETCQLPILSGSVAFAKHGAYDLIRMLPLEAEIKIPLQLGLQAPKAIFQIQS